MSVSNIASVTLEPGQTAQLNVDGSTVSLQVTTPTEPMLLGISGLPGTEWQSYLTHYGKDKIAYTRDFGKDNLYTVNGVYDADVYTEYTKWGSGKWIGADPRMMNHLSVKDDADEFLDQWAASFPATADLAALGFRGVAASPWHEPWDDVLKGTITWTWLQQQGRDIAAWRERHPRGKELIRWVGPILTKWDLVDKGNDPRNAGFDGMNVFFFDTYQDSPDDGRYETPAEMIDAVADKIHAAYPGIDLGIPEYGFAKQTNDSTGSGWVDAHRAFVQHARDRGDVRFACAFNSAGTMPEVPFYTSGPVAALYRDELLTPM